jgi:hypothetical protein
MKSPKEKAEELVNKYCNQKISFTYKDSQDGICIGSGLMLHSSAKQCALIAVDEIFNSIEVGFEDFKSLSKINYWQEVKQEIEILC